MSSLVRPVSGLQLTIGARLKDGMTRGQAAAEIDALGRVLERERPSSPVPSAWRLAAASPIPANLRLVVAGSLALLMGLVALVLAIACANVASVLLARAVARRREIAVRVAMGAGRGRLTRQLLTETLLLFALGGGAGLLFSCSLTSALPALLPTFAVPVAFSFVLDTRVLAFTAGLSLVAAVLSGVMPALHASRTDVVSALKDEGEGPADRPWLRHAFVVSQVAFSILLVVASGVFVRALDRLSSIDRGFDAHGVEVLQLDLSLGGYTDATGGVFIRALIDRVRELPGVDSATITIAVAGGAVRRELRARSANGPARPPAPDPRRFSPDVSWNAVMPDYFATLRIPIVAGRDFGASDRADTQAVAIVSQAAARRLWPGEPALEAIGREIPREVDLTSQMRSQAIVVGIVRDVSTGGGEPRPTVYVPLQQRYSSDVTVLARGASGQRVAGRIRALVASMSPSLPILGSQTLEEQLMSGPVPLQLRLAASVSACVGLIGLLLAAVGIYGVTAYAVVRRTREIGVRLALGAQGLEVAGLIVRQGMSLVALGSAIGMTLAAAAVRLLTRRLFGALPVDAVTFAAATLVFAAVGLAACYVPARRAIGVDPVTALRHE
jgi:predicted permease